MYKCKHSCYKNIPISTRTQSCLPSKSRSFRTTMFCFKKKIGIQGLQLYLNTLSNNLILIIQTNNTLKQLESSYSLASIATTTSPKSTLETRLARTFLCNHSYSSLSYATIIHTLSFKNTISPTNPTNIRYSTTTNTNFATSTITITIKSTSKTYSTTYTTHL